MKIDFNGMELEVKDLMNEGTDEQRDKAEWVEEYLKPMMMTARQDITDVIYLLCDGLELVQVCYDDEGWLYETVNVSADSKSGIAYDVIRKIF